MMNGKRLREIVENMTFCYAKDGGQGFVNKVNCTCNKTCQSYVDSELFHEMYKKLESQNLSRKEILTIIKGQMKSQWYKNNVEE